MLFIYCIVFISFFHQLFIVFIITFSFIMSKKYYHTLGETIQGYTIIIKINVYKAYYNYITLFIKLILIIIVLNLIIIVIV